MFHDLPVARIVEETREAKSIVLDVPPSLAAEFAYRPGQFVTVEVECDGERLRRCYSLASCPDVEHEHKFTVKRTRDGRVSNWLNDRLRPGDKLRVMRPEGRFVLDARDAPLLLFAGGSGITPVISILKSALKTTRRPATLLYANRDRGATIFAAELERLQHAHPGRLTVHHRLDDVHGLLDEPTVRAIAAGQPDASCWLCGPGPFMALVERALVGAGIPAEHVRVERFTIATPAATSPAPPAQPSGAEQPEFIDVELRGEKRRIPYVAGKTLLQVARDAGMDAPYSCEEGFCGCCASDLLEGKVTMTADDALTAEEKRRGMILACQSRPVTARCTFRFVDA
jgi:3-ketosteroid 9alpha-monooxygenase subunit B